jgi:hypothetical protein
MKTMLEKFAVGDVVSYHEDGGICMCKLTAYKKDDKEEEATVQILEVIRQPGVGHYKVGDSFEVWHRVDMGGWGGDWHIFHEGQQHSRTMPEN